MNDLAYHVKQDFSVEEKLLKEGLNQYADEMAGLARQSTGVFCYEADKLIGGVTGQMIGGSLTVKLLWVDKDHRKQKIGQALMQKIEDYAADNDCVVSFVDTFAYQAPGFYLKMGYHEETRIEKFYTDHDRVFYKKDLK